MTRQIFATVTTTGITIRAALPGEVYGDPLPFSAALLWELERQGQIWTSCRARWRWLQRMTPAPNGATMAVEAHHG